MVSFSRAKSIISLAIGQALCAGKIPSLEVQAQQLVPELAQTVYGRAKIKSLLTMSSGAATGLPHGDTVPGESGRWLQGVKTQLKTLQDYPDEAIPLFAKTGEGVFKYKNQDTSALVLVLLAATRRQVSTGNAQFQGYGYQIWTHFHRDRVGDVVWFRGVGGQLLALHPPSNRVMVYSALNDSVTEQVAAAFVNWVH